MDQDGNNVSGPERLQRDRRHEPRQLIDTTATLHLVDLAAQFHGRILDLSLSGCSIQTEQRFPVGIYRRVEAEFRVDGLPFRLAGVTQSIAGGADPHRIGVRFLDLSERKRAQLAQLMDEMRRAEAGA